MQGMGVLAYHVIFGAYGFWLPNDPRGSWSTFVRSWELFRAGGPATKTNSRRSAAAKPHNRELRLRAKESLKYPPVIFTGLQAQSIGGGFARMVEKAKYHVFACSILPDHVHMVLGRYRYSVETMVRLLKAQASIKLVEDARHPLMGYANADGTLPTPWAAKRWKVFLNDVDDVARAIKYVEENPIKEGKPRQRWSFVSDFSGII